MNDGFDLLAREMQKAFTQIVEVAVQPLREDIAEIKKDVAEVRSVITGDTCRDD